MTRPKKHGMAARRAAAAAFSFPRQRILLCNWYVKLVKPGKDLPSNHFQCHVPMKYVSSSAKYCLRVHVAGLYMRDVASTVLSPQNDKV